MTERMTVAETLIRRLRAHGVKRFFGVPGGDCSLDLIDAADRLGVEYVLTRSETAAAIMAATTGLLTGTPGVLMTTRGPGLANGVNGIACAALDRMPLLVLADGHEPEAAHASHQRFDQAALLRPLVKAESSLAGDDPAAEIDALIATACADPPGPVYVELIGKRVRGAAPEGRSGADAAAPPRAGSAAPGAAEVAAACAVLQRSRRPIVIAGLQAARAPGADAALRRLAAAWGCPVLTTYMAKGAIDDADPLALGPFIMGAAEEPVLRSADAILLFGADPIEFLPQPWHYTAPVVELTTHEFARPFLTPVASVVGDLAAAGDALVAAVRLDGWTRAEIAAACAAMRAGATEVPLPRDRASVSPHRVVETTAAALGDRDARIAVDAGAHMLPVMALWRARRPGDVLISRGLATMGSALPAAIGAALAEPDRPVIAFTGDGGLMMCASELATAAQFGCRNLHVIVLNDASMAMIEVKQRRRQFPASGMRYAPTDFAAVARGFGCAGLRVAAPERLEATLAEALAQPGPMLVDVPVDREAYHTLIRALRG